MEFGAHAVVGTWRPGEAVHAEDGDPALSTDPKRVFAAVRAGHERIELLGVFTDPGDAFARAARILPIEHRVKQIEHRVEVIDLAARGPSIWAAFSEESGSGNGDPPGVRIFATEAAARQHCREWLAAIRVELDTETTSLEGTPGYPIGPCPTVPMREYNRTPLSAGLWGNPEPHKAYAETLRPSFVGKLKWVYDPDAERREEGLKQGYHHDSGFVEACALVVKVPVKQHAPKKLAPTKAAVRKAVRKPAKKGTKKSPVRLRT